MIISHMFFAADCASSAQKTLPEASVESFPLFRNAVQSKVPSRRDPPVTSTPPAKVEDAVRDG